ncbi:hypothetical protein BDR03DRAFT_1002257 [Suillus americanus]|nr:hypothetical protein BDR03DRAFT_1002257 [Suillus americanus]
MAHGSQNGISPMHHHPEYYLKDGDITFHVQGTLFCVHRHFFERESQFFAKEFAKAPKEGTSDSTAFRLDKVSATDFANFLWVWYSRSYRLDSKSKDHWLTILDLSTTWQFPEMKQLAVDELQKLEIEPIEKITTYDRYNIDKSLLLPAYKLLCKRASRMSAEEGERLKMPTILGIHEARERALRSAAESGLSELQACRAVTHSYLFLDMKSLDADQISIQRGFRALRVMVQEAWSQVTLVSLERHCTSFQRCRSFYHAALGNYPLPSANVMESEVCMA